MPRYPKYFAYIELSSCTFTSSHVSFILSLNSASVAQETTEDRHNQKKISNSVICWRSFWFFFERGRLFFVGEKYMMIKTVIYFCYLHHLNSILLEFYAFTEDNLDQANSRIACYHISNLLSKARSFCV